LRLRRIDNGRELSRSGADILTKKHQRSVFVDDMELALLIGLVKRRAYTSVRQVSQARAHFLVQRVNSFDIYVKGLIVPQQPTVVARRAFK